MSIQSQSVAEEEDEVETEQPAHHPSAPADELFDISTTVDPSYVISLIRKLLPPTMKATSGSDGGSACDSSTQGTKERLVSEFEDKISENQCEAMDILNENPEWQEGSNDNSSHQEKDMGPPVGDDYWEEYGCILWDLATSRTHAELMVQNLVLEVILATLLVSQSPRVTEICLGIIGNLACHEVSRKQIVSVKGLVEIIVDQLFVDDTPCLCEEFRLLTLCLQGGEGITWAQSLQPEPVLSRMLWVTENTLNLQLIEKSVGLLLAVSESQQEVSTILLPNLVKLGLPVVLINLLAFEINKLVAEERLPERYSVLDIILRATEALSVTESCSQELCSSKKLLHLLTTLIKLPDKIEVATACVTAAVLVANILSDSGELILEICQDLLFLQGLLDIFPFASDDMEARNAIWDTISRLLAHVQENEPSPLNLHQLLSVLSSKSDLIEEELLDHKLAASNKDHENSTTSGENLHMRAAALKRIESIVHRWVLLKDHISPSDFAVEYGVNERDLERLKDCCSKYCK